MHRYSRWMVLVLTVLLAACRPAAGQDPNAPTAVMNALSSLPPSSVFSVEVPAGFAPSGHLATAVEIDSDFPMPTAPIRIDQDDLPAVAGSFWEGLEELSLLPEPFATYWDALRELPIQRRIDEGEPVVVGDEGADSLPLGRLSVERDGSTLVVHWLMEHGPEADEPSERMLWRIGAVAGGVQLDLWRSVPGGAREWVHLDTSSGESLLALLNPTAELETTLGYVSILETRGDLIVNRVRVHVAGSGGATDVLVVWSDAEAAGAALIREDRFQEEIYGGALGLLVAGVGVVLAPGEEGFNIDVDDVRYGRLFSAGYWRPLKGLQIDAEGGVWHGPDGHYLETAAPGSEGYGVYDAGIDTLIPNQWVAFAVPPMGTPRWIPVLWGPFPSGLSELADVARVRAELFDLYEAALIDPLLDPESSFLGAPDLMSMPEFERLRSP